MRISDSLHWVYFLATPWSCIFLLRKSGLIGFEPLSADLIFFLGFFLIISGASLSLGVIGGRSVKAPVAHERPLVSSGDVSLLTLFAVIYIVALAFDFFIVKSGSLSTITVVRELDSATGARMSVIGGVIAVASAAPYILLGLLIYRKDFGARAKTRPLALIALLGIAVSFLTGGRNSFLIGMTVIAAQYILTRKNRPYFKPKRYRGLVIRTFILGFIFFSLYLFADRELNQGVNANQILHNFSLKWNVDVTELDTGNVFFNILYSILIILIFYFTHPLNYLDQYFTSATSPLFMGAYNFPIPAKTIEVIFGVQTFSGLEQGLILPGVYLTLPGSLYLDFGYVGAIFVAFLMALATGVFYAIRKQLGFIAIQLLSFLIAIWILSPLYSVLGISNGFSFLIILFCLLIKRFIFRMT